MLIETRSLLGARTEPSQAPTKAAIARPPGLSERIARTPSPAIRSSYSQLQGPAMQMGLGICSRSESESTCEDANIGGKNRWPICTFTRTNARTTAGPWVTTTEERRAGADGGW